MLKDVPLINQYFPKLSGQQLKQFTQLKELYSSWNERINVISRKDIDNLYVNHVLHSLGIAKVMEFKAGANVLDVGTGGDFRGFHWPSFSRKHSFIWWIPSGKKLWW